ncbi:MAG: TfoX/Sxy family protein [Rhodospirillaceae bacterium]
MAISPEFRDHILDLLTALGPEQAKRMFGGGGLFLDGAMFRLVVDDELYLKIDDGNRPDFEALGAPPFTYERGGKTIALGYYLAPEDLLEYAAEFASWARKAREAALRSGVRAKKKGGKRKAASAGKP